MNVDTLDNHVSGDHRAPAPDSIRALDRACPAADPISLSLARARTRPARPVCAEPRSCKSYCESQVPYRSRVVRFSLASAGVGTTIPPARAHGGRPAGHDGERAAKDQDRAPVQGQSEDPVELGGVPRGVLRQGEWVGRERAPSRA